MGAARGGNGGRAEEETQSSIKFSKSCIIFIYKNTEDKMDGQVRRTGDRGLRCDVMQNNGVLLLFSRLALDKIVF